MRKLHASIVAAVAFAAVPAHAALIVETTTLNGVTLKFGASDPPFADKIKNNNAESGTTVILKSDSGRLVDYKGEGLGTDGVLVTSGNGDGFAKVMGSNGYIEALTIDPQGAIGFTGIDFNIGVFNIPGNTASYIGDITLFLQGGAPVVFQDVLFKHNENKFTALATGPGIVFEAIKFSDVHLSGPVKSKAKFYIGDEFESMRQVSIQFAPTAVPEASTWAMMIAGFGLVGGALRRKRPRTTAAPQAA